MERIGSFSVDHLRLEKGIYVSRKDDINGNIITTFDLRLRKPNVDKILTNKSIHATEHLIATFLRNHDKWKKETIYFGPMGCRTGFYVIFKGNLTSHHITDIIRDSFEFVANFKGEIPGATAIECGNYKDMSLEEAISDANDYLKVLNNLKEENLNYPE